MIRVPLRNRAGDVVAEALLDDADIGLARVPWYRLRGGYVVRTDVVDGRKHMRYLHRQVLGVASGMVDHINGDRLDNRRANLRPSTAALNAQNRGSNRRNPWGRGVCHRPARGTWEANVKLGGRVHYLGQHATPEAAASAAAAFRREHMPHSREAAAAG